MLAQGCTRLRHLAVRGCNQEVCAFQVQGHVSYCTIHTILYCIIRHNTIQYPALLHYIAYDNILNHDQHYGPEFLIQLCRYLKQTSN